MLDSILSLSFAIHSNKGVYALLLGSGVSKPAKVPTGWEIVEDLIRQIAKLSGEDCEPDPTKWYTKAFGKEPDYSELLDSIAKSPSERQLLLRSYFEPDEEERDKGFKQPTAAHKAIAELAIKGYIRVIITTNFDRLLEKAIESAGIAPIVIYNPDAAEGVIPLTHLNNRTIIIKVNGDYLDTRIKNTSAELEHYDERINRLLDRIFDEFGLIVCGWSGDWDKALSAALERCKNHRFTTFWTIHNEISDNAKRIIQLRKADIIKITGADHFFEELREKAAALEDYSKPHPLSKELAIVTLEKYIAEERYEIPLFNFIMKEANNLTNKLTEFKFPFSPPYDVKELGSGFDRLQAITEMLQALLIHGCFWGKANQTRIWVECIERIVNQASQLNSTEPPGIQYGLFPGLLLLYGGGLASVAAGKYDTLAALLTKAKSRDNSNKELPLVLIANSRTVLTKQMEEYLFPLDEDTPFNKYLYKKLREPLRAFLPDKNKYDDIFDRYEYLVTLITLDINDKMGLKTPIPGGCYYWRNANLPEQRIIVKLQREMGKESKDWLPFKAGLFDGSSTRFQTLSEKVRQYIKS